MASMFDEVDGLWQFKIVKMKYMPHPDYQIDDMEEMLERCFSMEQRSGWAHD